MGKVTTNRRLKKILQEIKIQSAELQPISTKPTSLLAPDPVIIQLRLATVLPRGSLRLLGRIPGLCSFILPAFFLHWLERILLPGDLFRLRNFSRISPADQYRTLRQRIQSRK